MYSDRLSQVSGIQQEAAKGAELLLMATFLQQYCLDEHKDADRETLEVTFSQSILSICSLDSIHRPA
jgi:hypothetical protein